MRKMLKRKGRGNSQSETNTTVASGPPKIWRAGEKKGIGHGDTEHTENELQLEDTNVTLLDGGTDRGLGTSFLALLLVVTRAREFAALDPRDSKCFARLADLRLGRPHQRLPEGRLSDLRIPEQLDCCQVG